MEEVEGKGAVNEEEVFEVYCGGRLSCFVIKSDEKWCCGQCCYFLTFSLFWMFEM